MIRGSEVRPGFNGVVGLPAKKLRAGDTVSGVVTFSSRGSMMNLCFGVLRSGGPPEIFFRAGDTVSCS